MRTSRLAALAVAVAIAAAVAATSASAFNILQEPLPTGAVGQPYSYQFKVVSNDPVSGVTFRVVRNALPPGLVLGSDGKVSGTPTQPGGWEFDVQACIGVNCSERTFSIGILTRLFVTTESVPAATVGVAYSVQLTAGGGGTPTWSLSAGTLPTGITLSATGLLAGTPTVLGQSEFTVRITDGNVRYDTKSLRLNVVAPVAIAPVRQPPAAVGSDFRLAITATGGVGPYTWSVAPGVTLPRGLALDPATGVIAGIPRAAGSFPITVAAADTSGSSATLDLTLAIAARLAIVTRSLPAAKVGRAYRTRVLTRGGIAPVRFAITEGAPPPGLRFDRKTGLLTGKPRVAGRYTMLVEATDRLGGISERNFVLVVRPAPKT